MTTNLAMIPHFFETDFICSKVKVTKQKGYTFMNYIKHALENNSLYGLCRSIILNDNKEVVCYSPPKSMTYDFFMEREMNADVVGMEFIEGTMINVFFDSVNYCWRISTRNTVDAEVSFYKFSNKTFNQMFNEACLINNLNIQSLNPKYCYSFVLQHPENRIVVPFKTAQLFLVAVYEICQTEDSALVKEIDLNELMREQVWTVRIPETYEFATYTELINKFASPNTPYDILGIVVKNVETGERTKFRNPIYEEVRQLRGNQPKLQYQYLCLRHSGKLSEFLKYYPESKSDMSKFRDQVHMFTNTLHQNYISCYVRKEKPLKEYSDKYRTHMFKLHEIFKNDLRPKNLFVTNTVVIDYVNMLHPSLLMYCLNHSLRKRMIDTINSSSDI